MNPFSVLSAYLSLQALISTAAIAAMATGLLWQGQYRAQLRAHYWALAAAFAFALSAPLLPGRTFEPAVRVWQAPAPNHPETNSRTYVKFSEKKAAPSVSEEGLSYFALAVTAMLLAAALAWGLREIFLLKQILRQAIAFRRQSGIALYFHAQIPAPLSLWLPGEASVLLPEYMAANPDSLKIALAHEIQHHRQRDTKWIYAVWFMRLACLGNPLAHIWGRRILEIQEFACDQALLQRRKVRARAYASCLLEVAENALRQKRSPACATGLSLLAERNLISRRIQVMLKQKQKKTPAFALICALITLTIATAAVAGKSLVQDRRISLAQASAMAENAQSAAFPIVINDRVLAQLNRYLGTPEDRKFMRETMARMENHRSMVEARLDAYGMPLELAAIPIVESGYQNLAETGASRAAGLWQFIRSTARNYGLRVDRSRDDRLDTQILTDAAMRYLQANYLRFRDWQLSVLSYNMGEDAVQEAMNATGSRDAWELVRRGHEGDSNYLAKVMAAVLILKNPESLK